MFAAIVARSRGKVVVSLSAVHFFLLWKIKVCKELSFQPVTHEVQVYREICIFSYFLVYYYFSCGSILFSYSSFNKPCFYLKLLLQ